MDESLRRNSHRATTGTGNTPVNTGPSYTGRLGVSHSQTISRNLLSRSSEYRSRAFSIAQARAKKDGVENYFLAVPSLDNKSGYRIGTRMEALNSNGSVKQISLWKDYAEFYRKGADSTKQTRASRQNPYNVMVGARHAIPEKRTGILRSIWQFFSR